MEWGHEGKFDSRVCTRKPQLHQIARVALTEMCPLCVLDFYVHENCQRQGVGKKLFDHMLKDQGVEPHVLAYDRPSSKLLSFLNKYFQLASYVPQNNNFVVFLMSNTITHLNKEVVRNRATVLVLVLVVHVLLMVTIVYNYLHK